LEALLAACRKKHIDKLALTDHNRLAGALRAHELDPERVIVGEEIQTTQGEILGYFMTEEVPAGLEPSEVIRRLKGQGAVISVAHPFDANRGSTHWSLETLEAMVSDLDGIEVFNARCIRPSYNQKALAFAQAHQLPGLAGSDAHSVFELGQATVLLPEFSNAEELRKSLRQAQLETRLSGAYVHLFSVWAKLVKRLRKQNSKK
jgi:predicted metal-dependent phosphoesterase TrpH